MTTEPFQIEYNHDLNRLGELLLQIDRPGNFNSFAVLRTSLAYFQADQIE
jgi:hypothetical protein